MSNGYKGLIALCKNGIVPQSNIKSSISWNLVVSRLQIIFGVLSK